MGECEGMIESVGSHWAGKSPKCQVRTLGWGLVKWGSTVSPGSAGTSAILAAAARGLGDLESAAGSDPGACRRWVRSRLGVLLWARLVLLAAVKTLQLHPDGCRLSAVHTPEMGP